MVILNIYPKLDFYTAKALELNVFACKTLNTNLKYFDACTVLNEDITRTDFSTYKKKL